MPGTVTNSSTDLGLQVLDQVINTRWKVLPRDQCQGTASIVKNIVTYLIMIRNPQFRRQFHH